MGDSRGCYVARVYYKDVFRTLWNIYHGTFLRQQLTTKFHKHYSKKNSITRARQGSKYASEFCSNIKVPAYLKYLQLLMSHEVLINIYHQSWL